jgi:hypothetical protein
MDRHDAPQAEVVQGTLQIQVSDVYGLARKYERLGLRVVEHGRDRALVMLPSGVRVVLARRRARSPHPRIAA